MVHTKLHWNGRLSFWWNISHPLHWKLSKTTPEVVKITTSNVASDENFVKMTTFSFQGTGVFPRPRSAARQCFVCSHPASSRLFWWFLSSVTRDRFITGPALPGTKAGSRDLEKNLRGSTSHAGRALSGNLSTILVQKMEWQSSSQVCMNGVVLRIKITVIRKCKHFVSLFTIINADPQAKWITHGSDDCSFRAVWHAPKKYTTPGVPFANMN